jgi:hypothetical protein
MAPLLRQMLAVHEAAHCVWHWVRRRPVHSVAVHGEGGEFRAVEGAGSHTPLYASNDVTDMLADCDRKTREGWLQEGVAFMVARTAQRRFGARDPVYDSWCANDLNMVDRIVRALDGSARERAENLLWIEDEAEEFVNRYWKQITRLADAILRHSGRLDEQQIRSALSRAPSVKLNAAGADLAYDLVSAGKINWGGFAWDSSDDNDLLDAEDEGSKYHLGVDAETVGAGKFHYPFTKTGDEVYVAALLDAEKQGGVIGEFAAQLLDKITAMKKQSQANTTRPRAYALPRRPGDEEGFRRRVDGYFLL